MLKHMYSSVEYTHHSSRVNPGILSPLPNSIEKSYYSVTKLIINNHFKNFCFGLSTRQKSAMTDMKIASDIYRRSPIQIFYFQPSPIFPNLVGNSFSKKIWQLTIQGLNHKQETEP